jgi:hypothetical protein
MIATTPNIHIQPVFHPSIPYPCKNPPPELLFEKCGALSDSFLLIVHRPF